MKHIKNFNQSELNVISVLDDLRTTFEYQDLIRYETEKDSEEEISSEDLEKILYDWQVQLESDYLTEGKQHNLADFDNRDTGIFTDFEKLYGKYSKGKELHDFRLKLVELSGGRCPICGVSFGYSQVTLDHILPKSVYPSLAILPINLVPICYYCNMRKNKKIGERVFHPYFEGYDLAHLLEVSITPDSSSIENSKVIINIKDFNNVLDIIKNNQIYDEICKNIDKYGLRERFSTVTQVIFYNLIKDFLYILNTKKIILTKENLCIYLQSFDVLDGGRITDNFQIDERFFKHLCIESILNSDVVLESIINRVNEHQLGRIDSILNDGIQKIRESWKNSELKIESNFLALLKSELKNCVFVGVFEQEISSYKLKFFNGKFQNKPIVIDDIDFLENYICYIDGKFLKNIESSKEVGTVVLIRVRNRLIFLAFEGSFNISETVLENLFELISHIF